jgi:hypothetical protein
MTRNSNDDLHEKRLRIFHHHIVYPQFAIMLQSDSILVYEILNHQASHDTGDQVLSMLTPLIHN